MTADITLFRRLRGAAADMDGVKRLAEREFYDAVRVLRGKKLLTNFPKRKCP